MSPALIQHFQPSLFMLGVFFESIEAPGYCVIEIRFPSTVNTNNNSYVLFAVSIKFKIDITIILSEIVEFDFRYFHKCSWIIFS